MLRYTRRSFLGQSAAVTAGLTTGLVAGTSSRAWSANDKIRVACVGVRGRGNSVMHSLDYCRFLMGLEEMPQAISCAGGKWFFDDDQQWPDTQMVTYEYPGQVVQYEMQLWSRPRLFNVTEGAAVYGENGWVLVTNNSWKAYDGANSLVREGTGDRAQTQQLHIRNFLDAVRSRDHTTLHQDIGSGHISSAMCHAGNIAWRTGKKLRFDPATELFDDQEANQYVGREHRRGFELPAVT